MSTWYYGSTLPSGREPTSGQLEMMNEVFSVTSVTKADTYGTVGMFGYERNSGDDCPWGECEDEYYFYMRFVPFYADLDSSVSIFRIWFQMGNTTSDWHGVELNNTTGTITVDTDMVPVSSTNSNFASNQNFDDDSEFRGRFYIQNGLYQVVIWRFIPRWE